MNVFHEFEPGILQFVKRRTESPGENRRPHQPQAGRSTLANGCRGPIDDDLLATKLFDTISRLPYSACVTVSKAVR